MPATLMALYRVIVEVWGYDQLVVRLPLTVCVYFVYERVEMKGKPSQSCPTLAKLPVKVRFQECPVALCY